MGHPADRPADGERRGEHRARETDRLHDHAGVELDIAGQGTIGLDFGERRQDLGLDRDRPFDEFTAEFARHVTEQRRARIGCPVHGVTETHDPAAGNHFAADPVPRSIGGADRIEGVECAARGSTVQRAGQGTDRCAHDVGHVGAGRRDHSSGERRRIETMIDRQDQVLLQGSGVSGVRHPTGHLLEIGRSMTEIGIGYDGRETVLGPVERTEQRRHGGRHVERLFPPLFGVEIEQRSEREWAGSGRERCAETGERCAGQRGCGVEQRTEAVGEAAPCCEIGPEAIRFGGVGEAPPIEKMPSVLEGCVPGQFDGVVVAVVVEAFVAEHGADRGVGDGHTVESCGYVDQVHASSVDRKPRLINVDLINVDGIHHPSDDGAVTTMIGSTEASRLLGVSKPTLYAYVSRGLIERHVAVDGRTSLYPRDQIERLAARGRTKTPSERPSIDVRIGSSITQLDDAALRYRGRDAAELARSCSYERVAGLLWSGDLADEAEAWHLDRRLLERCLAVAGSLIDDSAVAALGAAAHGLSAVTDGSETGADAARTLATIAPTLLGGPRRGSIAERLTKAYVRRPAAELVTAVDRALVLLADHELATSTLAVRVACSVRADPFASIAAGCSVVSGGLHGGASVETAGLVARADAEGAAATVAAFLDDGRRLPGFGHSVYRRGDPRVAPLLEAVRCIPGSDRTVELVDAVVAEAGRRLASLPNVDLALGALLHAGGFPPDMPVFAVARLAGWGAHYDEEVTERPVRFRGLTRLR